MQQVRLQASTQPRLVAGLLGGGRGAQPLRPCMSVHVLSGRRRAIFGDQLRTTNNSDNNNGTEKNKKLWMTKMPI